MSRRMVDGKVITAGVKSAAEIAFRKHQLLWKAEGLPPPGRFEDGRVVTEDAASRAETASRELAKQIAQREFEKPRIPLELAAAWIAWRSVERLGEEWRRDVWYSDSVGAQRGELLPALRGGRLRAYEGVREISPMEWDKVHESELSEFADVRVSRDDLTKNFAPNDDKEARKKAQREDAEIFVADRIPLGITGKALEEEAAAIGIPRQFVRDAHKRQTGDKKRLRGRPRKVQ